MLPKYEEMVNTIQEKSKKILDQKTRIYLDKKLDRELSNKVGIYKNINEVLDSLNFYLNKIGNRNRDLGPKKYDRYVGIILELR